MVRRASSTLLATTSSGHLPGHFPQVLYTILPTGPSPRPPLSWLRVSSLLLLPLLGGQALGGPGVDGGDLLLQGGVDEAMPRQQRLLLKLGRHNHRRERLSAPARHVLDGYVRRLQRSLQLRRQRLRRDDRVVRRRRGCRLRL